MVVPAITCYILSFICFCIAAAKVQSGIDFHNLGLAFLVLSLLVGRI